MTRLTFPSLISVLSLLAAPAGATTLSYSTGLANPLATLDFSGLVEGSVVGSAYAGQGVTFGGLYVSNALGNTLAPTTAPAAANFSGNTTNATFSISFAAPISDAAFFLYTDGFGTTITSTLGGVAVESLSAGGYHTNGADFFGFTDSRFDGITIAVAGSGNAVIDNVEVGNVAVAEPGSNAIMLAGLAGLMVMGGRRRV